MIGEVVSDDLVIKESMILLQGVTFPGKHTDVSEEHATSTSIRAEQSTDECLGLRLCGPQTVWAH